MELLRIAIWLVIIFGGGFWLTGKGIPFVYTHVMRAFGFKARMTPITAKRVNRFKSIKRGYWSFRVITTLFVCSLFLEMIVTDKALMIHYEGKTAFPAVAQWIDKAAFFADVSSFEKRSEFGQVGDSEVEYRQFAAHASAPAQLEQEIADLKTELAAERAEFASENPEPAPDAKEWKQKQYQRKVAALVKRQASIEQLETSLDVFKNGSAWALMPLYPYSPSNLRHELAKNPPNKPSFSVGVPLGTDVSGRDVVPLLLYGFRISLGFAILVALCGYAIGIVVGGIQGYFGGWTDIISQRFVEIWGSIPFLFMIMLIASIVQPDFLLLLALLVVFRSWIGITYYVRGEFYREKSKDYVQAAIGAGVSDYKIILKHILPNALVPIVTFAPFACVAYIGSLVSLDYLGFGLPPGTPSWGGLLRQGLENVKFYPHLVIVPTCALALTLYSVVMIGEAVREAFDPKVFSRLR